MRKTSLMITAAGLALGLGGLAKAQTTASRSTGSLASTAARWQDSVDAFAASDRAQPPARGGVLFVGSSSIRLWDDLEQAFGPDRPVLKRGFGGSRLADCVELVDRLVLPYAPALVVLYAGDNDLAEGATPQQVAERFEAFVAAVRSALPDTRIAFLSIKPSPLRAALVDSARQANALIAGRTRGDPLLDYIDVFTPMLDAEGRPRTELYGADRLHLNREGYALWRTLIADHLAVPGAPAAQTAAR